MEVRVPQSLFPKYVSLLHRLGDDSILDPLSNPALRLHRCRVGGRQVEMIYAPFDHVNTTARLVIVGLTPGLQQAQNAFRAAKQSLLNGAHHEEAQAEAKAYASFSGPMRSNLVKLMDSIGIQRALGINTTADLWACRSDLVHFTSALRYPVFVDGANWSGQPDMLKVPEMREWLETYTGQEMRALKNALFVPLGPKVASALRYLSSNGLFKSNQILEGLPHPSGANAERIACFLGDKPAHLASTKTNAAALLKSRSQLTQQISAFA